MKKQTDNRIVVVSVGRHTRLGDVMERALDGVPFETTDADALLIGDFRNRRLLFAASADASGKNTGMRSLAAALNGAQVRLDGCVCAIIADGEQGGAVHVDALGLLLAANAAGARVIPAPLLESGRELKHFTDGRETPFERYCNLAHALTARLAAYEFVTKDHPRVRLATPLKEGAANDWRAALRRIAVNAGGELSDEEDADCTILLCENTAGLPDGETLSLLDGTGTIRFWIASPETGSELFLLALLERACVRGGYALAPRGGYALAPRGVAVFEGVRAAEALADKAEAARIRKLPLF